MFGQVDADVAPSGISTEEVPIQRVFEIGAVQLTVEGREEARPVFVTACWRWFPVVRPIRSGTHGEGPQ